MKKFKSKIGFGIAIFMVILLCSSASIMIINNVWVGLAIVLIVAVFIGYSFTRTYYVINGNDLIIKSGFIINMTIKIDTIRKIVETHNPLSSPAVSLDRIAIYYNYNDSVMISPKNKLIFIDHLKKTNPKIEVVLKKNRH